MISAPAAWAVGAANGVFGVSSASLPIASFDALTKRNRQCRRLRVKRVYGRLTHLCEQSRLGHPGVLRASIIVTETINPRERRLVLRLLSYWRELAGERDMPQPSDIDGGRIPDMWGHCFLLEVRGSGEPAFGYIGEQLAAQLDKDLTGQAVSSAGSDTLLGQGASYHRQVLARGIPITLGGQFVNRERRAVLYRSILLPLGEGEGRITALFGGANCRELVAESGPVPGP